MHSAVIYPTLIWKMITSTFVGGAKDFAAVHFTRAQIGSHCVGGFYGLGGSVIVLRCMYAFSISSGYKGTSNIMC